ncbi:hypothetical protein PIROE2DRAFT_6396 [Piromyces sp. E2]|nr:hypothetical protein PIROE2DRAFT_6396 [Piromyces sp. E2]|eukprot:OUM66356.1 hypothetical protein PIROE2DRAFT_6396 [Piromyces sp. E2]
MLEPPKMFSDARHTSDVLEIESLAKLVYELDIQMDSNLFQTFETLVELAGTKQFLQTFSRFQYYLLNLKFIQNGCYGLGHSVPFQNNFYPLYQNVPMYQSQTPPSPTSPTQIPYPETAGINVNATNGNVNTNPTVAATSVASGAPLNTTAIGGMAGNPATPPYGSLPTPEFYSYGGSGAGTPPELLNTPPNYFPNQAGMIPSSSYPTPLDAATPYTNHLMGMAAAAPPPPPPPFEGVEGQGMTTSTTGVSMVSSTTSTTTTSSSSSSSVESSLNPELSSSSSITLSSTTDMDIDYPTTTTTTTSSSSTSTTSVEKKENKKVENSTATITTTTTNSKESTEDKKETVSPSEKEVKEAETEKVDVVMTEKEDEDKDKKDLKVVEKDEKIEETSSSTSKEVPTTEVKESSTTEIKESNIKKETSPSEEGGEKKEVVDTKTTTTSTSSTTPSTTTTTENTTVAVDGTVVKEEKNTNTPVVITEMDKTMYPNAEGLVGGFPISLNTTMFPYDGSMLKRPEMGMGEMAFHLTPPPADGTTPSSYPGYGFTPVDKMVTPGAGAPLTGQYYSGAGAPPPLYNRYGTAGGEQVGVNGTAIPTTGYYNSHNARYEPVNYSSSYPGYNTQQPSYVYRHVFNNQTPLHKISLPQQQYHMVKKNSSGNSKSSMKMGEMNKVKSYGNKKHSSESKKNGVYQNLFI